MTDEASSQAVRQSQKRPVAIVPNRRELRLFMVAGEHSGDALGGKLMAALNAQSRGRVRYLGVGGDAMRAQGMVSQFPIEEIAVMGPAAILGRLPTIMKRIRGTAEAAIAAEPDAVVIIDSPEFTHRVARRLRARRPSIPIIDYVSPSVWAWRPGRARRMRRYIDHVLALLPFEPEAHERLGGPPCTYVGHPLIEKAAYIHDLDLAPLRERIDAMPGQPILVVLAGSRHSEVVRMLRPFGDALTRLRERGISPAVVMPVVETVRAEIEAGVAAWPIKPLLVEGEDDKYRAFRLADAALATSGTVTLELALAGTPMVVGYMVDRVGAMVRPFLRTPSVVLANLVLGRNVFTEFLQEECTGEAFADSLLPLLSDTPERRQQIEALAEIPARLAIGDETPSDAAARIVLAFAEARDLKVK